MWTYITDNLTCQCLHYQIIFAYNFTLKLIIEVLMNNWHFWHMQILTTTLWPLWTTKTCKHQPWQMSHWLDFSLQSCWHNVAWGRSNFLDFFKSPSHGHSNSIWCVHTYWTPILGHFRDLDQFLGGVGSERGKLIFFWLIEFFPLDFQQYMTQTYLLNTIFGNFLAQEHFSGWAGGFGRSKYFWS